MFFGSFFPLVINASQGILNFHYLSHTFDNFLWFRYNSAIINKRGKLADNIIKL